MKRLIIFVFFSFFMFDCTTVQESGRRVSEDQEQWRQLNDLTVIAHHYGQYHKGIAFAQKAYQYALKQFGEEHPSTLISINNLALLYQSHGSYGEAEPLYKEALQLREKLLGKEHPDTLASMNNLALLYFEQSRYGETEPLYKGILQIAEKTLGENHPHTIATQLNYFGLLVNIERFRPAFRILKQVESRLLSRSFQELYTTFTERVRRKYLNTISNFQDLVFSFARQYPKPDHIRYAADVVLRWKQVYAEEDAFQHRVLNISHDPDFRRLKEKIANLRTELSNRIYHAKTGRDIPIVWQEITATESEIRDKAKAYISGLQVSGTDLDQVISSLPKQSALIEFRMYDSFNMKTAKHGKRHLAAYLVLPDIHAEQQVFFEDLGQVDEIISAVNKSEDRAKALYRHLLGKFDNHIRNVKNLFIAPDGGLNLISFAGMKLPDNRYLVQRQQISRLQTGRDLLSSSPIEPADILIAVGGVDYGGPTGKASARTASVRAEVQKGQLNERAARELAQMKYLEHSLDEANLIASLYEINCKEGKPRKYLGKQATESVLKNMEKPPRILHLSTHGFFLENAEAEEWAQEQPLLLSGLAMANANLGLKGKVDENGDDGLLYSLEVLGLNLRGTELVSLSACNTGKGVIDYSEGVYGLVRAFRTAGAKSVLMTLHKVGDRSSKVFFTKFYEIWLSSEDSPSPAKALHRTRLYFISHPNEKYREPAVWSPYVMVGR
ncbi:MAG: CHAT domain-containing protein [Desulfobacterales bacterium]|nr:CHAT domain-containing protein [Desulfobacterales bacterium]